MKKFKDKEYSLFLKIKKNFLFFLIFIFAFFCRFYSLDTSPSVQIDEPYTFYVTTASNKTPDGKLFKDNCNGFELEYSKKYNSREIKNSLFSSGRTATDLKFDLKSIWLQEVDRQHPSLYYFLVRVWNHDLKEFDAKNFVDHARAFNLLFFPFTFFILYKILQLISNDDKFISLGLIFGTCGLGTISLTPLAREYALQEMFFVLVTYIFLLISKSIKAREKLAYQRISLYSLGFALFLLTGYFALIYEFFIFIFLFLQIVYLKDKSAFKQFIFLAITTVFCTLLFCPFYFDFRTENEHYEKVLLSLYDLINPERLSLTFERLGKYLITYLFYPYFILSMLLFYIISKFNIVNKKRACLEIPFDIKTAVVFSLLWVICVMYLTPYKYSRFILPALPILSIILAVIVNKCDYVFSKILVVFFLLNTLIQINNGTWVDFRDRLYYQAGGLKDKYDTVIVNPTFFITYYLYVNLNEKDKIIVFERNTPKSDYMLDEYILVTNENEIVSKNSILLEDRSGHVEYYVSKKNKN